MESNLDYRAKEKEIYAKVGRAMADWAALEFHLMRLSSFALQSDLEKTTRIFSLFRTFALALDFTHQTCASKTKNTVYLNSLVDYIRELSGDRNHLAHTPLVSHGAGEPNETDWSKATPKIGPHPNNHILETMPKREPMDGAEVHEVSEDIRHATAELMSFIRFLENQPDSYSEKFQSKVVARRPRLSERRDKNGKIG